MKKWILGAAVASGLVLAQFAAAEHRNHHDANHGNGQHDNRYHSQHDNRQQHRRYDRIVIGGAVQNVHDNGHYRRHKDGHRRARHVHDRHCGHNRGHHRRRHGYSYDDYYGHGYRNNRHGNYYHGRRHHDRHYYARPGRRINHVIRVY